MEQQITSPKNNAVAIELTAVVVAVTAEEPRVLTIEDGRALPSGPFTSGHRTLQTGLRSWVERQTRHPLGYIEQLYTFADRDRTHGGAGERMISISYLALTREQDSAHRDPRWLYSLAAMPQYLQPLRDEVEAVINEEGWTKYAMSKLYKVDSFLKESMRLNRLSVSTQDFLFLFHP